MMSKFMVHGNDFYCFVEPEAIHQYSLASKGTRCKSSTLNGTRPILTELRCRKAFEALKMLGRPAKFEVGPNNTDLPSGCLLKTTDTASEDDIDVLWIPYLGEAPAPPPEPYRDICYSPKSSFDGKSPILKLTNGFRLYGLKCLFFV